MTQFDKLDPDIIAKAMSNPAGKVSVAQISIDMPDAANPPTFEFIPIFNIDTPAAPSTITVVTDSTDRIGIVDQAQVRVEDTPQIHADLFVSATSETRQQALSLVIEKLDKYGSYCVDSTGWQFEEGDFKLNENSVNLSEMIEVLNDIPDKNTHVDGRVVAVLVNAIIARAMTIGIHDWENTPYRDALKSSTFTSEDLPIVPDYVEPIVELGAFIEAKILEGSHISALESQSRFGDWDTDMLLTTLSIIHNRISAGPGTFVDPNRVRENWESFYKDTELELLAFEFTKFRREATMVGSDGLSTEGAKLLQNIQFLIQGKKTD